MTAQVGAQLGQSIAMLEKSLISTTWFAAQHDEERRAWEKHRSQLAAAGTFFSDLSESLAKHADQLRAMDQRI